MPRTLLNHLSPDQLMDLKIDYAFKQLFGIEKNKDITIVFLNAVLRRTRENRIQMITFKNTEFIGEYDGDKESRLDIVAVTESKEYINIEIQFNNHYDMIKRSLYYWACLFQAPMEKGMAYKELSPVITINILNFTIFQPSSQTFHHTYHLYEDHEYHRLTDHMELHFLEIPKLIQQWRKKNLDPENDILARWLLMLGMVDRRKRRFYEEIYNELEEIAMRDKTLQGAFEKWETLSASKEKRLEYESRSKVILDAAAIKREAELREKEAIEKAREEGKKEGIQEGIEEGKDKRDWEVAKKMLAEGCGMELIMKITGLRIEEIKRLQQDREKD